MGPEWSKLFSRSGAAASLKRSRPFWSCEASLHVHVLFLLACVSVILDSTSLQHWGYKVLSTLLRTQPEMSRADKFTRPPTLVFPVLPLRCLCQNSLLSPNRRFSFLMRKDCLLLSVWSYSLNTLPDSVWAKHTILFGGSAQTLGLFPSEKSELNPFRLHLKATAAFSCSILLVKCLLKAENTGRTSKIKPYPSAILKIFSCFASKYILVLLTIPICDTF